MVIVLTSGLRSLNGFLVRLLLRVGTFWHLTLKLAFFSVLLAQASHSVQASAWRLCWGTTDLSIHKSIVVLRGRKFTQLAITKAVPCRKTVRRNSRNRDSWKSECVCSVFYTTLVHTRRC